MKQSGKSGQTKFEILRAKSGKFQWQLRGSDGKIVEIKTGSVRLPKTTAAKRKSANSAVQHALGLAAGKQEA